MSHPTKRRANRWSLRLNLCGGMRSTEYPSSQLCTRAHVYGYPSYNEDFSRYAYAVKKKRQPQSMRTVVVSVLFLFNTTP